MEIAPLQSSEATWRSYTAGFIGSLICTLAAYSVVTTSQGGRIEILTTIVGLALVQLVIQFILFLHLGRRGSGSNGVMFAFAAIFVAIVVVGSLWIMNNLSARMMLSPDQMDQYMDSQATGGL